MFGLGAVVIALFVAGAVWRAFNPNASEAPTGDETQLAAWQDGYYLCLHRPQMTPAQMYRLVQRKLPHDSRTIALRGCQAAQKGIKG
jgi:hypothetical protein